MITGKCTRAPNPEMVKQFLYRIRKLMIRSEIKIAVETGASAGEVWRLCWKDFNVQRARLNLQSLSR
jgi:integrase